jgi:hypothetical protein
MNAAEVLVDLQAKGVALAPDGDRLRWRAPKGAMTPELLARVREAKPALLALLSRPVPASDGDRTDWREWFEERAAVIEHDGQAPRPEAEARAFECAVVEWLNRNPAPSSPGWCAGCGNPESAGAVVVPFGGDGSRHAWLHPGCWPTWYARRCHQAALALRTLGIEAPAGWRLPNGTTP